MNLSPKDNVVISISFKGMLSRLKNVLLKELLLLSLLLLSILLLVLL